jgi:hypothetical protein
MTKESAQHFRAYYLYLKKGKLEKQQFAGKGLLGWLEFFGDPRLIGEEEMASPLVSFLSHTHREDE